jgi:hypothetical protein
LKPEYYWTPRLGEVLSLRPSDLGEMTPAQLFAGHRYAHSDDD